MLITTYIIHSINFKNSFFFLELVCSRLKGKLKVLVSWLRLLCIGKLKKKGLNKFFVLINITNFDFSP